MWRVFDSMTTAVYFVVASIALTAPAYALDSDTQLQSEPRETRPLAGKSVIGIEPVLPDNRMDLTGSRVTAGPTFGNSLARINDMRTWKSGIKEAPDNVGSQTPDGSFSPDDVVELMGSTLNQETLSGDSTLSGSTDVVRHEIDAVVPTVELGTNGSRINDENVTIVANSAIPAFNSVVNVTTGLTVSRPAVENQTRNASVAGKSGMPELQTQVDDVESLTVDTVEDTASPVYKMMNPVKDPVNNAIDLSRKDVVTNTTELTKMDPASHFVKPVAFVANEGVNSSDFNVSTMFDTTAPVVNTVDRTADLKRREAVNNSKFWVDEAPVVNTIKHTIDSISRVSNATASNMAVSVAPVASAPSNTTGFTAKTVAPDVNTETQKVAKTATFMTFNATTASPTTDTAPNAFTSTPAKEEATQVVRGTTFESAETSPAVQVMPSETGSSMTTIEQISSQNEEAKMKPTNSNGTSLTVSQSPDPKTETSSGEDDTAFSKYSSKREQSTFADGSSDNDDFDIDGFSSEDEVSNRKSFMSSDAGTANAMKTPLNSTTDVALTTELAESGNAFASTPAAVDGSFNFNEFNVADASSLSADSMSTSASMDGLDDIVFPRMEPKKKAAGSASRSAWMEIPDIVATPSPELAKTALRPDPPAALAPSPVAAPVAAVAPPPLAPSGTDSTESQEALSKRAKDVSGGNGAGTSALFVVVGAMGCVAICAIVVYVKKQNHETETIDSGSERVSMSEAVGARSSEGSVYNDPLGTRYSSIVMITPNGDGVCIL